jgi:hypothetical protein
LLPALLTPGRIKSLVNKGLPFDRFRFDSEFITG